MGGKSSKANIQAGDGHCFREFEEEDLEIPSLSGLPLVSARTYVVGLRLTVVQGDITRTATDAMVHPTGSKPGPYGQIGKMLVAAAGPELAVDFTAGYVQVGRAPGDERRVITANDRARSFRIVPHGGPRGPKPST